MPGVLEVVNRRGLVDALQSKGVTILSEHEAKEITADTLFVTSKRDGEKKGIKTDWVILASGVQSNDSLANALKGKISQLHRVGDCKEPRTILTAVYEGARVAMQI